MPLFTIRMFEGELTGSQAADLIQYVTEVVIPFVIKKLRENTWVLIEEIKSGSREISGKILGLSDVRAIQLSE